MKLMVLVLLLARPLTLIGLSNGYVRGDDDKRFVMEISQKLIIRLAFLFDVLTLCFSCEVKN